MARLPRLYLPDQPLHVIQRGNNRNLIFATQQDYMFYLRCLQEAAETHQLSVHAYALMTNPVRANMVAQPDDYPWSSFRANAQGKTNPLVSPQVRDCSLRYLIFSAFDTPR